MGLQARGRSVRVVAVYALAAVGGWCAYGQTTQATEQHAAADTRAQRETVTETIFLKNVTGQNDLNDIQTALRNNFPWAKIYGVAGPYAITVRDTAEEMAGIKKMVSELDQPKKVYRITYAVSDVENGRRTGTQHYSLVVTAGGRTTLKEGKRVPLVMGVTSDSSKPEQQVQYMDVGMNIDASISGQALKTRMELESVADEKPGTGVQDPVIQQTMLDGVASLTGGKPVLLGSMEVPGTSRQEEIEVTTELVTQ